MFITLEDFEADEVKILVKHFHLDNEESNYPILYTEFESTSPDFAQGLPSTGTSFLTESACPPSPYTGGWWLETCNQSNLNGLNLRSEASDEEGLGITWIEWKGSKYSLKRTEMKIRPMRDESPSTPLIYSLPFKFKF